MLNHPEVSCLWQCFLIVYMQDRAGDTKLGAQSHALAETTIMNLQLVAAWGCC